MKCDRLRRRVLHICAALEVSVSARFKPSQYLADHEGATIRRVAVHAKFQVTTTGSQ